MPGDLLQKMIKSWSRKTAIDVKYTPQTKVERWNPRLIGTFFATYNCNLQLGDAQICSSEELKGFSNLEDARLRCRFWLWNLPGCKKYALASCRKPGAIFYEKGVDNLTPIQKSFAPLLVISNVLNAMNTQFGFDFVVQNETQSLECESMSVFQVNRMILYTMSHSSCYIKWKSRFYLDWMHYHLAPSQSCLLVMWIKLICHCMHTFSVGWKFWGQIVFGLLVLPDDTDDARIKNSQNMHDSRMIQKKYGYLKKTF